jgi:hypothetical protein
MIRARHPISALCAAALATGASWLIPPAAGAAPAVDLCNDAGYGAQLKTTFSRVDPAIGEYVNTAQWDVSGTFPAVDCRSLTLTGGHMTVGPLSFDIPDGALQIGYTTERVMTATGRTVASEPPLSAGDAPGPDPATNTDSGSIRMRHLGFRSTVIPVHQFGVDSVQFGLVSNVRDALQFTDGISGDMQGSDITNIDDPGRIRVKGLYLKLNGPALGGACRVGTAVPHSTGEVTTYSDNYVYPTPAPTPATTGCGLLDPVVDTVIHNNGNYSATLNWSQQIEP